jgi:hypothetical protein
VASGDQQAACAVQYTSTEKRQPHQPRLAHLNDSRLKVQLPDVEFRLRGTLCSPSDSPPFHPICHTANIFSQMSEIQKQPRFKSASLYDGMCNKCWARQQEGSKPFPACSGCKEVSHLKVLTSTGSLTTIGPVLRKLVFYFRNFCRQRATRFLLCQNKVCQKADWPVHKVSRFKT